GKHRKNSNGWSNEGLSYIAGYLARKLKDLHPNLGKQTSNIEGFEETQSPLIELLPPLHPIFEFCHFLENNFQFFQNSHQDAIDKDPMFF
ncbi:Hypothetical protein FKW44_007098, partial [Caligus rogercresseyi]